MRYIFCVVFILLCIVSCSNDKPTPSMPPESSDSIEPKTQNLVVRIFIDASGSMIGYVTPSTSTNYARILPCLESAVLSGWSDGKAEFYKFGTDAIALKKRDEYLDAAKPNFYKDPSIYRETYIQKVIDHKENKLDGLIIIMTDLAQNRSDVNLLVGKLKEKYIKNDLAVGILGIRSQFSGNICEVDVDGSSFPYQSKENLETFRPFYLLMLGKHADIVEYFNQLNSKGLNFISGNNFVIFSPHLVEKLSSFEGSKLDSPPENFQERNTLVPSASKDKRFKQFRFLDKYKNAKFSVITGYSSHPYTMPFKSDEIETEILAKCCEKDGLVDDQRVKNALNITSVSLSNNSLGFSAEVTPSSLSTRKMYLYEVVMRPKATAYIYPVWFKGWSMDTNKFDGSKTVNLNQFLNDLWQTTVQVHAPRIGRFYCYVKRD